MADWTEEDARRYVERHGLPDISAENLERMRMLSGRVAATGRSIRRMPDKADEPAGVFRVPLPNRTG